MGFIIPLPLLYRVPLWPKGHRGPWCRQLVALRHRTCVTAGPPHTASPRRGGGVVVPGDPVGVTAWRAEARCAVPSPLQPPRRLVRLRLPVVHLAQRPPTDCRGSPSRVSVVGLTARFRSAGSAWSPEQTRSIRCVRSRQGCSWFRTVLPCACYRIRGPVPPGTGPGLVVRLFSAVPCTRRRTVCRSHRRQPWWPRDPPQPVLLPREPDRRFRPW